jgi:hypothetical protein
MLIRWFLNGKSQHVQSPRDEDVWENGHDAPHIKDLVAIWMFYLRERRPSLIRDTDEV